MRVQGTVKLMLTAFAAFFYLPVGLATPAQENITAPQPKVIAQEGKGRLLDVNGTRVLLLAGSPYEMGYQQGRLLKKDVNALIDIALKVVSQAELKGKSAPSNSITEQVLKRTAPFIPFRYRQELQGLADGADLPLEKVQLAGLFPELFHCSGFALFGKATKEGHLLHGRILDYMTDIGLQKFAVVTVARPNGRNAFITVGYAGFIGSVTGMNDKKIAIGQLGGEGFGQWDGMPMAYLIRKVLEDADSLQQAVCIFRQTPRTCEHYYVISDGKIPDARGLVCTPRKFEIISPNQPCFILARTDPSTKTRQALSFVPVEDAVLISTGPDRYAELLGRVKSHYGGIDSKRAIELMLRPVAMEMNLHNALFAPGSLDLWVANAVDPNENNYQACFQKYYHYNLKELLNFRATVLTARGRLKGPKGS